MAEILRGRPPNIGMRVLGLTASFSAGKAKSWDQISTDKKDMESLIGGSIFQPSLPSRAMLEWLPVAFVDGVPTNRISEEFGSDLKRVDHADISKVGRSTEAVLYHLGRRAFLFAWEECVVAQIEAKMENDGLMNETKQNVPALIDALDQLRDALPSLVTNLHNSEKLDKYPLISNKFEVLFDLVSSRLASPAVQWQPGGLQWVL